ncbi:thioredoxin family protein [Legionella feeleii]|nr:thioredoxin family protein [Legionella feeleii]
MKKIIKCLAGIMIMMPLVSFSTVIPFNKSDCAALAMPKTVILVHASWCSHCRSFMPTYQKVSDLKKYSGWTFYSVENDEFEKICGTSIHGVPATFKNNMKKVLLGNKSQAMLESFLDS